MAIQKVEYYLNGQTPDPARQREEPRWKRQSRCRRTRSAPAVSYRPAPNGRRWRHPPATHGQGTRQDRGEVGEVPLRLWCNPRMVTQVVKWRDAMAETPRAADIAIAQLSRLLEFARLRGQGGPSTSPPASRTL